MSVQSNMPHAPPRAAWHELYRQMRCDLRCEMSEKSRLRGELRSTLDALDKARMALHNERIAHYDTVAEGIVSAQKREINVLMWLVCTGSVGVLAAVAALMRSY